MSSWASLYFNTRGRAGNIAGVYTPVVASTSAFIRLPATSAIRTRRFKRCSAPADKPPCLLPVSRGSNNGSLTVTGYSDANIKETMKIMNSKFPGVCRDCGAQVQRGSTIGYHGRGAGISCSRCIGKAEPAANPVVGPCWECKAPEGKFRQYGAATPVYCDVCETRIRPTTFDYKLRHAKPGKSEDYACSDMGYEDRCAEACGPGL